MIYFLILLVFLTVDLSCHDQSPLSNSTTYCHLLKCPIAKWFSSLWHIDISFHLAKLVVFGVILYHPVFPISSRVLNQQLFTSINRCCTCAGMILVLTVHAARMVLFSVVPFCVFVSVCVFVLYLQGWLVALPSRGVATGVDIGIYTPQNQPK